MIAGGLQDPAVFWHTGGRGGPELMPRVTREGGSRCRTGHCSPRRAAAAAPAAELVEAGFALENADAPLLHAGLNLADLAHVLDLRSAA